MRNRPAPLTDRDRSKKKTSSSKLPMGMLVTITGISGHLRRNTQLYPFVLDQPLGYLASQTPNLTLHAQGPGSQVVGLRTED